MMPSYGHSSNPPAIRRARMPRLATSGMDGKRAMKPYSTKSMPG